MLWLRFFKLNQAQKLTKSDISMTDGFSEKKISCRNTLQKEYYEKTK